MKNRIGHWGPLAALLLLALPALAQEQSVKPGINDSFKNPDVNRYIKMFEGESRTIYKYRHEIVETLGLKPGMTVADIGAGTGFFSLLFSDEVGDSGTVYSVDIAENFIDHIKKISKEHEKTNIDAIVCTARSVELPPESIDVAFISDVYHHFEYPFDTMASLHKALKPGGIVIIVDFERVKGVSRQWTLNHVRCGKGTLTDEVKDSGFDLVEEIDLGMGDQYILKFRKREPKQASE
jgi:ubiquinone/menaquinone biosynthesis C-methylase UbiE